MNSSQPEADTEYSTSPRGSGRRRGRPVGPSQRAKRLPGAAAPQAAGIARALAWTGAALLAAAEFCPLLQVRTIAAHPRLVHTVQGGPHHGWALLVIAVLAALLSLRARRPGGLPFAVMVALLGAGALAVALGSDLPDAHAAGLVATGGTGPAEAQAHAAIGLYLETLGAVALLLSGAIAGLLAPRMRGGRRGRTDSSAAVTASATETRGLPTARDRGLR
jgi:hypothetical protein